MLSLLWQAVAPLLQSLSRVNNSQHSSCSLPPPGFIFIQVQDRPLLGISHPLFRAGQHGASHRGAHSSKAPLRTGAGTSFFFCSLHNFFFQEDLCTPPSHPDFLRGTTGNPAAAEPRIQGGLSPADSEAKYTCPAPSIARWCLGEQSPACARFTAVIRLAAGADSRLRLAASASLAGGRNASPRRQAAGTAGLEARYITISTLPVCLFVNTRLSRLLGRTRTCSGRFMHTPSA